MLPTPLNKIANHMHSFDRKSETWLLKAETLKMIHTNKSQITHKGTKQRQDNEYIITIKKTQDLMMLSLVS